jgi:biopolymer transport protein ExbD
MKIPEYLKPKAISLNMTPLIDIVFLLIIFFIVSSNLIRQDISMPLDLPKSETIEPTKELETRKMTINIPDSETILVGGQLASPAMLREIFFQQRQISGKDTEIRIRTNKDVPYGTIEPILVLAAESGIWNVSFAVVEKRL